MKKIVILSIKAYQKIDIFGSFIFRSIFFDTNVCRFSPTCSDYTIDCIEKYGVVGGVIKGARRVMRCHPFSKGGFDPVTPKRP